MYALIQEMILYRNGLEGSCLPDEEVVSGFEKRYREILLKEKEEYEYIPPGKYYRDGYNLYRRMDILHDPRVPATNNEAERLLRKYKRKQAQAVSFRSESSIDYLCQCMSMLVLMRKNEKMNLFDRVSEIFGYRKPMD